MVGCRFDRHAFHVSVNGKYRKLSGQPRTHARPHTPAGEWRPTRPRLSLPFWSSTRRYASTSATVGRHRNGPSRRGVRRPEGHASWCSFPHGDFLGVCWCDRDFAPVNVRVQPRRLVISTVAVGCKPRLGRSGAWASQDLTLSRFAFAEARFLRLRCTTEPRRDRGTTRDVCFRGRDCSESGTPLQTEREDDPAASSKGHMQS